MCRMFGLPGPFRVDVVLCWRHLLGKWKNEADGATTAVLLARQIMVAGSPCGGGFNPMQLQVMV